MGRKLGRGGALPPFWGVGWVPIEHKVPWAEAYLHTNGTVWPQYTKVTDRQTNRTDRKTDRTDRQTGQRTDSIGEPFCKRSPNNWCIVECNVSLFMVALWNRETIYIFMLWFVLSSFFFFLA